MVAPGAEIADTITVTGTGGSTGSMEAVLYGYLTPEANQQCTTITDADWRAAIAAGDVAAISRETIDIDGDGEYITAPVTVGEEDALGCATWYESMTLDDAPDVVTETPYGVETETTIVLVPQVITIAHSDLLQVGGEFADTVTITGTHGEAGVVTGDILGPLPGMVQSDGSVSCDFVDWTDAPVYAELEEQAFIGDGELEMPAVEIDEPGCYTARETLTLDRGDVTTVHEAGLPSQTLYFAPTPTSGAVSNGGISAGDVPGLPGAPAAAVAAGGISAVALAGAGTLLARRRRVM